MSKVTDRWLRRRATNFQAVVLGKSFMAAHLVLEHGMDPEEVADRLRMTADDVRRVSVPVTPFSGWGEGDTHDR